MEVNLALERLIRYYNSAEEIGGWHASSVCVCVFFFSLRVGVIPESSV